MKQIKIPIDVNVENINSYVNLKIVSKAVMELPLGKWEVVIRKPIRSSKQNRALHVFFRIISDALNEAHQYYKYEVLEKEHVIPWNSGIVKDRIWRPLQQAMTQKESTTKITVQEVNNIVEQLQRMFSEKGLIIDFPSIDHVLNNLKSYEIIE